jgi:asparagine synthetase B (glutamine-hydrolysing)
MFALALWEAEATLLARDAFGKKPPFLTTRPGALLFASEIVNDAA